MRTKNSVTKLLFDVIMVLSLGALLLLFWTSQAAASPSGRRQVTICHRPPGNPGNGQTLTVPAAAVPAHLAHGDSLGPCPNGTATNTPTGTLVPTRTATPTPTPTNTPTPLPTATVAPGWYEVGTGSASGGGISNNSTASQHPSLAVAPDNTLYITWQDDVSGNFENYEIYVRRWNGSSWDEVGAGSASGGGISNNSGYSTDPSLVIAPDNTPYIAWQDDSGGDAEIYVRRWNGSSWEEVGAGSASGGGISNNSGHSAAPTLAIAPDNTPYIAWADDTNYSSGLTEIYIRRWNGSIWEEVGAGSASGGGISNSSGISGSPALAVAPDNAPYVAWHDNSGGDTEIYVRRWNGSSWVEVGAGSASGGGISNNIGNSHEPSLAVAADNTLYVAWTDFSSGDYEIYVRRWNGSSWVEVGAGSASGGGISNSSGSAGSVTLAVAPDNTPYVTWEDTGSGDVEIYVRRWNGSSWEEVGAGSASGGGISNNSAASIFPSLGVAPDNTPYVAWTDFSGGDSEIYVLRWLE